MEDRISPDENRQDPEQNAEAQEAEALAQAFSGSTREERERLARIVDLLPCYVALIDEQRRILFHNKAFEQFFGRPGDKLCYEAMRGLTAPCRVCLPLDPESRNGDGVMEWVQPRSGHAFRVHSYPFAEADGTPRILKVGFNITASLRVQQALDLSEQSYRAITDNLSIGIALLDPKRRIKAGNIRLSQWFGEGFHLDRSICDLLQCGAEYARAIPEPGFTCPDCPFQASLNDGASHEKEISVSFQDGMERIVRLVTCPVKQSKTGPKKRPVRAIIMMLEDITNRLRVNQQLQRARKLEAMNTLAGGIAHEINQPLSALHLYAGGLQMLLEKPQELPREVTRERLALIMTEADKIRSIISHMRALVMQEEPVPLAGVSLSTVVDNVMGIMRQQLHLRGVQAVIEVPDTLPLVRSNDVQLEQVLVNLLANALHAIDNDGESGRSGGPPRTRKVLVRARLMPENSRVRLEVADSGPGLPEGGERIFDPFFTTKERHEGMGLGLSIVHGLVSLWGGEISAVVSHGELGGAAFFVDLALAENGEPARASGQGSNERESPDVQDPHGKIRVHSATRSTPRPKAIFNIRRSSSAKDPENDRGGA